MHGTFGDNEVDKLECNANRQTFSLLDRVILSVDNLTNAHNVCDYNNKY